MKCPWFLQPFFLPSFTTILSVRDEAEQLKFKTLKPVNGLVYEYKPISR
jgi:hypothetical protein